MELVAIEGNPIPAGAVVEAVEARDGVRLRAARWPATAEARRGTVLLFQGRAEFIEKYFETIEELRGRGFDVATLDWRGQGGSQRLTGDARKGHVRSFFDYALDLEAFLDRFAAPSCPPPWYGLAHSMGAAVLLDAAADGRVPVERLLCLAPMLAVHRVGSPAGVRLLAGALTLAGLARAYIPGGSGTPIYAKPFGGNPLSGDPGRYARLGAIAAAAPQLAIGDPTVGWVAAAFRQMERLAERGFAPSLKVPTMVLAAGADTVVSTPAIEQFAARLKTGPAIVIPHSRHELLTERDAIRAQVWAAFDQFIPGSGPEADIGAEHEATDEDAPPPG